MNFSSHPNCGSRCYGWPGSDRVGSKGEGFFRSSSFNSRANAEEVARRLQELKW